VSLTEEDKHWIVDLMHQVVGEATRQSEARLTLLITNVKESLEAEMHDGFSAMSARLDDSSARLDRHAAYWQTGRRWSGRMEEWAEKIDKALEVKDRQIMDLTERLRRIEQK
jgi:hypothetical protein